MGDNSGSGARVLIADDNPVNQKIAAAMLKKFGIASDSVNNGIEVVLAVDRRPYDLILMDCQMPEMDGYEATREIRLREANGRRTPIVALTASPFEGDRERCFAAGMDGYLPKPLRESHLIPILAQWMPSTVDDNPLAASAFDNLRAMPGGGDALIRELAALYLEDAPARLEAIRRAVAAGDGAALFSAAHGLKSGSANIGAVHVQELAARLEDLGRRGDLAAAPPIVESLDREYERAQKKLRELTA